MTDATIIATFSRRMRVSCDSGQELDARIKGRKLKPVCCDRVVVEAIDGENDVLITRIQRRKNELTRPNLRGEHEVLAANVGLLIVVAAASPKPDWFIIDRYLCAAELMGVPACVVFNKSELVSKADFEEPLSVYARLGYSTVVTSVTDASGICELGDVIGNNTAIIVGQSGVGKSSLINRLTEVSKQKTAEISSKTGEGRHTTVNSVRIPLPGGGNIIDSPGVRDYAPALRSAGDAITGFREIASLSDQCRFANCRHLSEPNCAIKAAVETGTINARRYESYRRVVRQSKL